MRRTNYLLNEVLDLIQKNTAHLKHMLECMTCRQGYWRRKETSDARNIIAFW